MNLRILALLPGALVAACAGAPAQQAPAAPREPPKAVYPSTYKAAVAPPTLIRGGTVLTGSGARLDGADHEKKAAAGSKDAKPPPPRDLRLETLAAALQGELLVQMHCYRADEMALVLDLADEYGYKVTAFHHSVAAR